MKASDFEPHSRGDGKRFHVREIRSCTECGREFQVYGLGLNHVAMCKTSEAANMIADALEFQASHDATHEAGVSIKTIKEKRKEILRNAGVEDRPGIVVCLKCKRPVVADMHGQLHCDCYSEVDHDAHANP